MKMKETSRGKDKEPYGNNKLFLNPERRSMPKQYWAFRVNSITQRCA